MSFKSLPFFLLSFGLLSGCTNSCQGNKTPPPAPEQPAAESNTEAQPANDQAPQDHAANESSGDVVASAE